MKRNSLATAVQSQAASARPAETNNQNQRLAQLRLCVNKVTVQPLDDLVIEDNVRQQVETNEPEFHSLVNSIRANGILQNLIADLQVSGENYRLVVIGGQRRLLAAREANLSKGPVLILERQSSSERTALGLRENLQRKDLHCLDIADAYATLCENGWTTVQIAAEFERHERTIKRYLKLAAYPPTIKQRIREFPDIFTTHVLFNQFSNKVFANEQSLSEIIEQMIAGASGEKQEGRAPSVRRPSTGEPVKKYASKIQEVSGLKTKIKGDEKKGKITLSYENPEQLRKFLGLIGAEN